MNGNAQEGQDHRGQEANSMSVKERTQTLLEETRRRR